MISGIYEEGRPEKAYLRLRKGYKPNTVMLCAVDDMGYLLPGGNLIVFDTDTQRFRLCERVSHDIGLELDSAGRIVMHG